MGRIASCTPAAPRGTALRNRIKGVACAFALVLAASAAPLAQSRSAGDALDSVSVEDLKEIYLSCSGAAVNGQLDNAGVMQCSIVYELLKQRAFGGDFLRMLAWSQAHPIVGSTGRQIPMSREIR